MWTNENKRFAHNATLFLVGPHLGRAGTLCHCVAQAQNRGNYANNCKNNCVGRVMFGSVEELFADVCGLWRCRCERLPPCCTCAVEVFWTKKNATTFPCPRWAGVNAWDAMIKHQQCLATTMRKAHVWTMHVRSKFPPVVRARSAQNLGQVVRTGTRGHCQVLGSLAMQLVVLDSHDRLIRYH